MIILEKKFAKIIYKILKLKETKSMSLNISQISNWDSLNNLQLLISLEKEFKIKFNENELSNFTSLNKIFNILKKKLNAKNQKFN